MFKELVGPLYENEADLHLEFRDLLSAELPGGGKCVKIKSVSFLFCYTSPNLMFLLYI